MRFDEGPWTRLRWIEEKSLLTENLNLDSVTDLPITEPFVAWTVESSGGKVHTHEDLEWFSENVYDCLYQTVEGPLAKVLQNLEGKPCSGLQAWF